MRHEEISSDSATARVAYPRSSHGRAGDATGPFIRNRHRLVDHRSDDRARRFGEGAARQRSDQFHRERRGRHEWTGRRRHLRRGLHVIGDHAANLVRRQRAARLRQRRAAQRNDHRCESDKRRQHRGGLAHLPVQPRQTERDRVTPDLHRSVRLEGWRPELDKRPPTARKLPIPDRSGPRVRRGRPSLLVERRVA